MNVVTARDRGWLALDSLRVFGPFRGVDVAGLRTALAGLHEAWPDHPAVCLLDRRAGRWLRLSTSDFAAHLDDLVSRVPDPGGPDGAAADALTRHLLGTPPDARPIVLAVCRGFVGAKVSHAVGDGRVVNTLLPELIRAAAARRPARPPVPAASRLPVARAVLHHFGRHPLGLLHPLRMLRPVAVPPPPVPAPAATVAWRPDPAYVSVRSATALDRMRAWRDRELPGVSAAAIQFAALAGALAEVGLPAAGPGAVMLVDARRYLPPGRGAGGNFSWGLYLRPRRLTDPAAVHHALHRELRAGSALAMLALRTARLGVTGVPPAAPVPDRVVAGARPRLTLTHLGRLDGYLDLPWVGPPEHWRSISVPTTSGPDAVTASFAELAGVLHLNLSFHRTTFDPSTVEAAAELACAAPRGRAVVDVAAPGGV